MKIGIFGGTFDPVHIGHVEMARYAKENFSLERVIFVPNGNPPHKKGRSIEDFSHRFKMLEIACEGCKGFEISDYERGTHFSYSLDTMRHFRKIYGNDVYFIIGADSLLTIHKWYEYEKLLKENKFIVFLRGDDKILSDCVEKYRKIGCEIYTADMPEICASSTKIRNDVALGVLPDEILNEKVAQYIRENGLYGGKK